MFVLGAALRIILSIPLMSGLFFKNCFAGYQESTSEAKALFQC